MDLIPRTLFIDAGGVLVRPNWSRVCGWFGKHDKVVDAGRLAHAELTAVRELDTPEFISGTSDASRWSRFAASMRPSSCASLELDRHVQLLVDRVDASGALIDQRLVWLPSSVPSRTQVYFEVRVEPAASYRVAVFAYELPNRP